MSKQLPIFCPACDQAGRESLVETLTHAKSADGAMMVRCPMNHTYDYARLMQLKPRMVPMVIQEKQPAQTMTHTIWIYPEALATLKERYPQNFMTTMCAALTALADPDTILVEGEHARALRSSGITKGRSIMQLVEDNQSLRARLAEAETRMKVLEPFFAAFGAKMPELGQPDLQAEVEPASATPGFKFHIPRPSGI